MKTVYSAPAKIILSGEHSVVYTKPAFVSAVDFHLTATIQEGRGKPHSDFTEKAIKYADKIVLDYLKKEKITPDIRTYGITIESTIPEGRGMGSSAAFCVALSAALLHFYTSREWDKQTISSLAYHCEKYFHGIRSGVDVSASTYGGLIFYRKEFEFLKTISALNFKIPKSFEERMILIDTGKPTESTKEMVSRVGRLYNENPRHMEQTFSAIERVTKRMVVSIVKEDFSMFTDCITENERFLEELGIVSLSTKSLLEDLKPYGAGKVTGAGGIKAGSGLVLFLVNNPDIAEVLKKRSIVTMPFKQDLKGVSHII